MFPEQETNVFDCKCYTEYKMVKNPNWQEQTSWLFTSVTEELNLALLRNNSCLLVVGAGSATSGFQFRCPLGGHGDSCNCNTTSLKIPTYSGRHTRQLAINKALRTEGLNSATPRTK